MFEKEFVLEYFKQIQKKIKHERIVKRELDISLGRKPIAIIGPRRVGKTYLLLDIVRGNKDIIYFDLEHSALRNLDHRDVFEIISIFEEYFKVKINKVVLDEVQRIDNWETLIRSLIDTGYMVAISGSSSKLLGKEIATQLRGRAITHLLLPLSFREYLLFKDIHFGRHFSISDKTRAINQLEEFLKWGGYPEIVLYRERKENILKEYFETVLQKDFIERFEVVHTYVAKLIFEFVFQNFSKEISVNKIADFVASRLKKNGKNIVYDYVEKLPESFSVFFVEKFEKSIYKRKLGRKVYICDTGLSTVLQFETDIGKRMENTVFLELLRKTNKRPLLSIYYWKDYQQREVDFVVKEGAKVNQLIQVTYASGKDEIEKREIRALSRASDLLKCKKLLVITWDYENEEKIRNKIIKFTPLWKWLLRDTNFYSKKV